MATLTLIVLTSAIISTFYEKAVVRYMKKYLNEHLLTQISMDDIRFRVLKGFPNATVEISHLVVLSGDHFSAKDFKGSYADTLLKARKVFFQFDLIMLFHKNYELKKVEFARGFINVLFDKHGSHNLEVWKSGENPGRESRSLNLQGITASDMRVRWIDLKRGIKMTTFTSKTSFRGTYAGNILSGEARGVFSNSFLAVRDRLWMNKADMDIRSKMLYAEDRFRIKQGKLNLNKAEINFQGEYINGPDRKIDLSLAVPRFGLQEFISMLPLQNDSVFLKYHFAGRGSLNGTLKGLLSDPDHLQIHADYSLTGCSARNIRTRSTISHIDVSGAVSGTNASNFRLALDNFTSSLGRGGISGNMQITSLHDLMMHAGIKSDIDLEALRDFIDVPALKNLEGIIKADFVAEGKLGRFRADSAVQLLDLLKYGTFDFQDAGLKIRHPDAILQHMTGRATLRNIIALENVSVRINDNDFHVDGKMQNLSGYLLRKGILKSDLSVRMNDFSLYGFLGYKPGAESNKKRGSILLIPRRMLLNAQLYAGTFDAGKFRATDVTATFALAGDSLFIPRFSMKFPEGTIAGDALISQNQDLLLSITCNSLSTRINIRQLFTSFNNFTQHFIMDKNVNGSLNGKISFFAQWDSTLRFLPKSLKAKGDLEISDGQLVQFEPMMKLSKYINVDELRLIRFSTLKNEIYIQDRLVTVPEMAIHSSAFNISVSGQQSFDNVFEYRLDVLLSEVLFNKARKKKKEMEEFMVENSREDQTTIPLILAGTPDKFDVKFDRKRAFSLTRKKMGQGSDRIPEAGNFRIDWDEKRTDPSVIMDTTSSVTRQNDFKIEWEEDDKSDKNDL
jgi:hypothetical protein